MFSCGFLRTPFSLSNSGGCWGKVKMYLSCSSNFLPPIYLETRAGISHREDFWKKAAPKILKSQEQVSAPCENVFISKSAEAHFM